MSPAFTHPARLPAVRLNTHLKCRTIATLSTQLELHPASLTRMLLPTLPISPAVALLCTLTQPPHPYTLFIQRVTVTSMTVTTLRLTTLRLRLPSILSCLLRPPVPLPRLPATLAIPLSIPMHTQRAPSMEMNTKSPLRRLPGMMLILLHLQRLLSTTTTR